MDILLLNFILYLFTFVYFYTKSNRTLTIHVFTWLVYTIVAFMGYFCFITGIYEETFGKKDEGSLSFMPYIYCFIMMYLLTTPLRSINLENTCITNIPSDRFLNRWISFMFFVNIVSLSFYIYTLGSLSSLSYVEIYQLGATGEMDVTTGSNFLDSVFGKCQLITRVCNPLFNISCLFLLSNNPHSKKPLFFFVCTFFIQVPPYLLKGDRGGYSFWQYNMFFIYFCFGNPYLSK